MTDGNMNGPASPDTIWTSDFKSAFRGFLVIPPISGGAPVDLGKDSGCHPRRGLATRAAVPLCLAIGWQCEKVPH